MNLLGAGLAWLGYELLKKKESTGIGQFRARYPGTPGVPVKQPPIGTRVRWQDLPAGPEWGQPSARALELQSQREAEKAEAVRRDIEAALNQLAQELRWLDSPLAYRRDRAKAALARLMAIRRLAVFGY